jgi:hypothetical protein
LQSLQGKAKFIHFFVPDYAIRAHGFLRLLWHDIMFQWDQNSQAAFDSLKEEINKSPLITPPDYDKDYILYRSASEVLVARVFV